jgi:uncharacterized phosphosugar-binding protein
MDEQTSKEIIRIADMIIDSQDRTTHAVRSIAGFVVIVVPASAIATLMIFWNQIALGGLILVIGFLSAIYIGFSEFYQSRD